MRFACGFASLVAALHLAAADPAMAPPAPAPRPLPVTAPPARSAPASGPAFGPTSDLDGTYLWLGPIGAASRIDARWDSTFGAETALVVVRERERIGALGANLGASRWTARGGGRVWVDGLIGTRLAGHLAGISLGPIVELSDLAHPRPGGSLGVWAFAGITPFVRVGAVAELGMFAEFGVHISLPVLRR
jgi:hypothetical protein